MPSHAETRAFAGAINTSLGYELAGEKSDSRVVLLSSGAKPLRIGKE
jgi:wyosine [tRNA(Phe)-imidazoG37] synthetase (radical SAM superfamily)